MVHFFGCIFRMKASVCEKKKSEIYANASTRTYVSTRSLNLGVWRCACACVHAKIKNAKFNSKAISWFCENLHHRKFPAIRYHCLTGNQ